METLGIAAVGLLVIVVGVVFGLVMIFFLIRSFLYRTAHGVLYRVADKAVDKALDAGVEGVKTLGKSVGEEMRKNDPRRLEGAATRVARAKQGRLAVSDLMAAEDVAQPVAERCLKGLASRGVCRPVQEAEGTFYLFDAFRERVQVAACDYCGGKFEDADLTAPCPSCGATLVPRTVVVE